MDKEFTGAWFMVTVATPVPTSMLVRTKSEDDERNRTTVGLQ
jgi:hypothetical protein